VAQLVVLWVSDVKSINQIVAQVQRLLSTHNVFIYQIILLTTTTIIIINCLQPVVGLSIVSVWKHQSYFLV